MPTARGYNTIQHFSYDGTFLGADEWRDSVGASLPISVTAGGKG